MNEPWRWNPKLIFHVFVENTKQFQKPYDTYAHWSCFIADEGEFSYRMRDIREKAVSGDIVLCPPETAFHRSTSRLSFHFIGFHWDQASAPTEAIPPNGRLRILNERRLRSTLALLRETNTGNTEATLAYKRHLFRDLWQLYAMEASKHVPSGLVSDDPFVQRAVRLIRERCGNGSSLKAVAQELGISQVQLTRLFKKEFKMTPNQYAANLRIERVAHLLVHTGLTLADIAERCGYADEHHVSKAFKAAMGINPSLYRKTHTV